MSAASTSMARNSTKTTASRVDRWPMSNAPIALNKTVTQPKGGASNAALPTLAPEGLVTESARREYAEALRPWYETAGRRERSRMLGECCRPAVIAKRPSDACGVVGSQQLAR